MQSSPLFEIARVFVRLDYAARFIVNANGFEKCRQPFDIGPNKRSSFRRQVGRSMPVIMTHHSVE
jgi:hypothetical protein